MNNVVKFNPIHQKKKATEIPNTSFYFLDKLKNESQNT